MCTWVFVYGSAIALAVCRRSLNAEAWGLARVSPCGICDGQSGTEAEFSSNTSVSPLSIIPPWLSTLIYHLEDEQKVRWWPQFRHIASRSTTTCFLVTRESIHQFAPHVPCLCIETSKRFYTGQNSEKVNRVRVPVMDFSVVRKLSTIKGRCQDESCLFWQTDYNNKGHNPEKLPCICCPVKFVFCILKR
jgi:hypothetical protein